MHFNPWQLVIGLFLGIFIGWIYYLARNLGLGSIIHASVKFCEILNTILIIIDSIVMVLLSTYHLKQEFDKTANNAALK